MYFTEVVNSSAVQAQKFCIASAERYSPKVQYDTDEQSIADYIGGMSSEGTTPRSPKHKVGSPKHKVDIYLCTW